MSKKVALVGHCGPDSSYLRSAVSSSVRGATIVMIDEAARLEKALTDGLDLVLMNRQLDWGFETEEGVELIRQLRTKHPNVKTMLVSNYPDAQQEAVAAGALPGFGKREIGTSRVTELLKSALE
ncbi:MAG: response regulator [Anaerolineae bacterium]|nr:response regulator [Phycisphaerae bacterium]